MINKKSNVIDFDFKDKKFFEIQSRINKEINNAFDDMVKLNPQDNNMNILGTYYFLFFWSIVERSYNGSKKWDKTYLIKIINSIMLGNRPLNNKEKYKISKEKNDTRSNN